MASCGPTIPISNPSIATPGKTQADKHIPTGDGGDDTTLPFDTADIASLSYLLDQNHKGWCLQYKWWMDALRHHGGNRRNIQEMEDISKTWKSMDVDAKEFKTTTWGKITQLIGDIKSYADDQAASSYPREMLKIVREYNEENDKPDPDHVRLSALKQNMQSTAKAVIAGFDEPRAKRETAVKTFGDFETACGNYVFKTDKGIQSPTELSDDMGDSKVIMAEIRKLVSENPALAAYEDPFRDYIIPEAKKGIKLWVEEVIQVIQKVKEAWNSIEANLATIRDLAELDFENIPPTLIAKAHLDEHVDEWNNLKDYANKYMEVAQLR